MLTSLYELARGAIGFSLVIGGAILLFQAGQGRVRRHLGLLFCSVGFLLCYSSLHLEAFVPEILGNLLLVTALFALGQSLFEVSLYLLGGEHRRRLSRRVRIAGAMWFLLIWIVPFLDYVIGWKAEGGLIDSEMGLAPLHTAAAVAAYLWLIGISVVAVRAGRFSLRDIPTHGSEVRILARAAMVLLALLCAILLGMSLGSVPVYRAGHLGLAVLTLVSYFVVALKPQLFVRVRREIQEEHDRKQLLGEEEMLEIDRRIARVLADPALLYRSNLNLRNLAGIVKLPPYRLSLYFNDRIKMSFSVWLNTQRITYVCRQMADLPDRSILEISLSAGYSSRSVFNRQFQRIVGASPSEYRSSLSGSSPPSAAPPPAAPGRTHARKTRRGRPLWPRRGC